jgi:hypothetical protein
LQPFETFSDHLFLCFHLFSRDLFSQPFLGSRHLFSKPFLATFSKPFKTFQNLSKPFKTFQNLSKPYKTFQNLSKPFLSKIFLPNNRLTPVCSSLGIWMDTESADFAPMRACPPQRCLPLLLLWTTAAALLDGPGRPLARRHWPTPVSFASEDLYGRLKDLLREAPGEESAEAFRLTLTSVDDLAVQLRPLVGVVLAPRVAELAHSPGFVTP